MADAFACASPKFGPETTEINCLSCDGFIAKGRAKLTRCDQATAKLSVAQMKELIGEAPPGPWPKGWAHWHNTRDAHIELAEEYIQQVDASPKPEFSIPRGIVIAGGANPRPGKPHGYMPCLWVLVNQLRRVGCTLPIQVWHLGPLEMDPFLARLLSEFGVECIDALELTAEHPARILCGWELKLYATILSPFKEVLFLDADNCPVRNPEYLFDDPAYAELGSMFWPDYAHWELKPGQWEYFGLEHRKEPALETGQYIVNKDVCWREIMLAWWYAEHSDYTFHHVYGDKETFHLAWRKLGRDYALPRLPGWECSHTIVQHDMQGNRQWLHRVQDKWRLRGGNRFCDSLEHEAENVKLVKELAGVWNGRLWDNQTPTRPERERMEALAGVPFVYRRLPIGDFKGDERTLTLWPDGRVGVGAAECESRWSVFEIMGASGMPEPILAICRDDRPTCLLRLSEGGIWRGEWLEHERCKVELTPRPEKMDAAEAARQATLLLKGAGWNVHPENLAIWMQGGSDGMAQESKPAGEIFQAHGLVNALAGPDFNADASR